MAKQTVLKISYRLIFLVLLILLGAAACSQAEEEKLLIAPEGTFAVDPLFREFYDYLGGADILGPAISPIFQDGNKKYQYTQSACLEYDPDLSPSERFRLSPLGRDMGISEPAVLPPSSGDALYVEGHTIYEGFVSLYRQLGGARFVGNPLTEAHYNPGKKRVEQYFENVGFAWLEGDTSDNVFLLAYGAWKCDVYCRHLPPLNTVIELPVRKYSDVEKPFREVVGRLGADFTGFALTEPYLANDGNLEQIYENVVLVTSPENPARVWLRPLPGKLGILEEPLAPPKNMDGMFFFPKNGDLGFNVPEVFIDYVTVHGGMEVSGEPIGELYRISDMVFRQCFGNLCLQFHRNAPAGMQIRPAPLGYSYRDVFYHPVDESFVVTQDIRAITLQVWERYQFVGKDQSEEIGVGVFENQTPLQGREPVMILTLPDGSEKTYYFPPTGSDGKSYLKLEPIPAQNGTLIPYKVCISSLTGEYFCTMDSFVIWFDL